MVEGFKKTEIGLYPNDWIEDKLENVITVLTDFTANGSFASLAQNVKYLDKPNYARLIRLTDIRADFKNDAIYISKDAYSFLSKSKLFGNELLLANVGAYAGYSFLYPNRLPFKGSLGPNMFLIKFNEKIFASKYAFYSFTFDVILQQLLSKAASSAQPKLNKQNVRECLVCYPPSKAEQTAIATALNDADALITQLEKLIAKKKAMKQGTMQELLKPKEGWETKTLGEVFDITAGGDFKKDFSSRIQDERHPYPIYSNSLQNYGAYGFCSYFTNEVNCITVTARGTIGYSCYRDHKFTAIGRLLVLKPKLNIDCFYFSEYINNKIEFVLEVTGVPQLTAPQISKYEVSFPKSKIEQTHIAEILSDMDIEILRLEDKLEKQKQLKQGMMQSLLTGKIRLV
jgi:type I restriction enzyme S subunit